MFYSHVCAIILRQYYLIRSGFTRVIPLFMWVTIDILLWGFLTKYLDGVSTKGFKAVPVFLGAILLWDFLVRVMMGVTMAFFEDVWSRNFLNMFASPVTVLEYVFGLVTSSILTSLVSLLAMLLLASTVFGFSIFSYGIIVLPYFLTLFLFGIALGILGSGIVLRLGPSSEWFVWPIPAVISPFAGAFYPISTLPQAMQYISYLLPPSYVFEDLRAIVHGVPYSLHGLAVSGALSIVYVILAYFFFHRMYRHALKSGLIAKYSAESLN